MIFKQTVGNEREIRREEFKKIVTSKNVRSSHSVFFISGFSSFDAFFMSHCELSFVSSFLHFAFVVWQRRFAPASADKAREVSKRDRLVKFYSLLASS